MAKHYELVWRTHGGARPGAGRPPKGDKAGEPHLRRPSHQKKHPLHITIKVAPDIGSLRDRELLLAIREATHITAKREDFRIVHLSVSGDELDLLVEADSRHALTRGIRGFQISAAGQIKRVLTARTGEQRTGVFPDRYRLRALTTPEEVDAAIASVVKSVPDDFVVWPPHTTLLAEGLARHGAA
jgi:hypothetical protein